MSEKRAMWHCVNYELNVWMCTGKNGCGGEIALAQGTPKNSGMKFCPYCGMKMHAQLDADFLHVKEEAQ